MVNVKIIGLKIGEMWSVFIISELLTPLKSDYGKCQNYWLENWWDLISFHYFPLVTFDKLQIKRTLISLFSASCLIKAFQTKAVYELSNSSQNSTRIRLTPNSSQVWVDQVEFEFEIEFKDTHLFNSRVGSIYIYIYIAQESIIYININS